MRVFDLHCDVLYKLWKDPTIRFESSEQLHTTYEALTSVGHQNIQCFAIYIPEHVPEQQRYYVALEMVDIFFEKILVLPQMRFIRTNEDYVNLLPHEIGAILTLEGCDAIGSDIIKLKTLLRLGVQSVGLTWNYANAVADGCLEERGAGLTSFGKRVIQMNNAFKVWTDVSHLSEKGFWDVLSIAHYPVASHSNAKAMRDHPRNLSDAQICALIERNALIGLTFVPEFLTKRDQASIDDLLLHVEHLCALGGRDHIGFGSDFDGIDETMINLSSFRDYSKLINELLKRYPEETVKGFLYENALHKMPK